MLTAGNKITRETNLRFSGAPSTKYVDRLLWHLVYIICVAVYSTRTKLRTNLSASGVGAAPMPKWSRICRMRKHQYHPVRLYMALSAPHMTWKAHRLQLIGLRNHLKAIVTQKQIILGFTKLVESLACGARQDKIKILKVNVTRSDDC